MICAVALALLCATFALGDEIFSITDSQRRLLVIGDDASVAQTHALFLADLSELGFKITVKTASDQTLQVAEYGEWLYDGIILAAPNANALGGFVDARKLLEFVESGRSMLVLAGPSFGSVTRRIASHCGVTLLGGVRDHAAHHESDDGENSLVFVDGDFRPANAAHIFGAAFEKARIAGEQEPSAVYRGVGIKVPLSSTLLTPLMRARATAYVVDDDGNMPTGNALVGGNAVSLMATLNARNGARVTFAGSLELFGDALLALGESPAVRAQLVGVTTWTFGQRGVLRARNVEHRAVGDKVGAHDNGHYRVGQDIEYGVTVEEWNGAVGAWQPFVATDMQLEFTMLDPHVRQFLKHTGAGRYSLQFKLPDVYGVFTFRTVYARPGFTTLITETRVPVRPLRHDEYERFISSAFPYYASSFSMMAGLFVFSIVFLYHKDKK